MKRIGRSKTYKSTRMQSTPHSAFTEEKAALSIFELSPTREPTTGIKLPAAKRTDRIAKESAAVAKAFCRAREAQMSVKNKMQSRLTFFFNHATGPFKVPSSIWSVTDRAKREFNSGANRDDVKVLTAAREKLSEDAMVPADAGEPDRVKSIVVTGSEVRKKL